MFYPMGWKIAATVIVGYGIWATDVHGPIAVWLLAALILLDLRSRARGIAERTERVAGIHDGAGR